MMSWHRWLGVVCAPALLLLGYAACSDDEAQESLCVEGDNIFCRCPGGQPGTKPCLPGGESFGPCEPCTGRTSTGTGTGTGAGTGTGTGAGTGTGTGAGTGGGSTGTLPLYAPCDWDGDCESNRCPLGYCTIDCTAVSDCEQGVAECVEFTPEIVVCMPVCSTQSDCESYGCSGGVCSQCGYAEAVDLWGVTTCADWGADIDFPPEGTECSYDEQCNLGMVGAQRVCHTFGVCAIGCYQPTDCPAGMDCNSQGAIGVCE